MYSHWSALLCMRCVLLPEMGLLKSKCNKETTTTRTTVHIRTAMLCMRCVLLPEMGLL